MKRLPKWDTTLYHNFLIERRKTPFQWGSNDCCLFAADGILTITGVDIAVDFRGKYDDKISAFELIKEVTGGSTVADAASYCASKFDLKEFEHPLFAQRGDLVVFPNDNNLIAGLVHQNGRDVVSVSELGLICEPLTMVKRAWHV